MLLFLFLLLSLSLLSSRSLYLVCSKGANSVEDRPRRMSSSTFHGTHPDVHKSIKNKRSKLCSSTTCLKDFLCALKSNLNSFWSPRFNSQVTSLKQTYRFALGLRWSARRAAPPWFKREAAALKGRKAAEEGQLLVAVPAPQQLKLCADVDGVHGQRRGIEEVEQAHLEREDNLAI